jgi:hypothetical protein
MKHPHGSIARGMLPAKTIVLTCEAKQAHYRTPTALLHSPSRGDGRRTMAAIRFGGNGYRSAVLTARCR